MDKKITTSSRLYIPRQHILTRDLIKDFMLILMAGALACAYIAVARPQILIAAILTTAAVLSVFLFVRSAMPAGYQQTQLAVHMTQKGFVAEHAPLIIAGRACRMRYIIDFSAIRTVEYSRPLNCVHVVGNCAKQLCTADNLRILTNDEGNEMFLYMDESACFTLIRMLEENHVDIVMRN